MNLPISVFESLTEFISGTHPKELEALAEAMETERINFESSSVGISRVKNLGADTARRVSLMFTSIKGLVDEQNAAVAIRVASGVREYERSSAPSLEIAWTGPEIPNQLGLVRPTSAIIREMLLSVRDVGEILIVGYALTSFTDSFMEEVLSFVGDAASRGANVRFILHSDDNETNKANLIAGWPQGVRPPFVYTWKPKDGGPYTKMHAKCIVVDRLEALITSANLTFHGLEKNLELGLRVRGVHAAAIADRFESLIIDGIFERWE